MLHLLSRRETPSYPFDLSITLSGDGCASYSFELSNVAGPPDFEADLRDGHFDGAGRRHWVDFASVASVLESFNAKLIEKL